MKRASSGDIAATPTLRAQRGTVTVRLNVDGRHFDTTASTPRLEYFVFVPILSGRIGHTVHADGRLFIDRCGVLFGYLLQWLRTHARPTKRILDEHGNGLLKDYSYCGQ